MLEQYWLSIAEIARSWAEETGESSSALERDLEAWILEFNKRKPSRSSESADPSEKTIESLVAELGGRHILKQTLEVYCEERGRAKPSFWFGSDPSDSVPPPPAISSAPDADSPDVEMPPGEGSTTAEQSYDTPDTSYLQPQADNGESPPVGDDIGEPPRFTGRRSSRWQSYANEPPPAEREQVTYLPPIPLKPKTQYSQPAPGFGNLRRAGKDWLDRLSRLTYAAQVACVLAFGLPIVVTILFFWPYENEFVAVEGKPPAPQQSQSSVAANSETSLQAEPSASEVATLKKKLAAAEQRIVNLGTAALASKAEAIRLTSRLEEVQKAQQAAKQAAAVEAEVLHRELRKAQDRIASLGAEAGAAKAEAARLAGLLDESRQIREATRKKAAADVQSKRRELNAAHGRIASLGTEMGVAKARANRLATQLDETQQAHDAAYKATAAELETTRRELTLALQSASAIAARRDRELTTARDRIASLSAVAEATKAEVARLADELIHAEQTHEAVRNAATAEAEAERQESTLALQSASAIAALRNRDLASARDRIASLSAEAKAAKMEALRLTEELVRARRTHVAVGETAAAKAEAKRRELTLVLQTASAATAENDRELRDRIASLGAELDAAKAEAVRLADELARLQSAYKSARQTAAIQASAKRQELKAARVRIAGLRAEAEAARAEAARLAGEPVRSQSAHATEGAAVQANAARPHGWSENGRSGAPPAREEPDVRSETRSKEQRLIEEGELLETSFEQAELAAAMEGSQRVAPEPVRQGAGIARQSQEKIILARASIPVAVATPTNGGEEAHDTSPELKGAPVDLDSAWEVVDVDQLVSEPGGYQGRDLTVTGSLLRLLQRYRLLSKSERNSLIVDVTAVRDIQQLKLKQAIEKAGLAGSVRARIKGTVASGSKANYLFVAHEISLIE